MKQTKQFVVLALAVLCTTSIAFSQSSFTARYNSFINEIKSITIDGFPSGYYIIANVFEKEVKLKNFLSGLKSKGLSADSFLNPKNQYNYVYIAKTDNKSAAVEMCLSKMNTTYNDDAWIVEVNKNETIITNLD